MTQSYYLPVNRKLAEYIDQFDLENEREGSDFETGCSRQYNDFTPDQDVQRGDVYFADTSESGFGEFRSGLLAKFEKKREQYQGRPGLFPLLNWLELLEAHGDYKLHMTVGRVRLKWLEQYFDSRILKVTKRKSKDDIQISLTIDPARLTAQQISKLEAFYSAVRIKASVPREIINKAEFGIDILNLYVLVEKILLPPRSENASLPQTQAMSVTSITPQGFMQNLKFYYPYLLTVEEAHFAHRVMAYLADDGVGAVSYSILLSQLVKIDNVYFLRVIKRILSAINERDSLVLAKIVTMGLSKLSANGAPLSTPIIALNNGRLNPNDMTPGSNGTDGANIRPSLLETGSYLFDYMLGRVSERNNWEQTVLGRASRVYLNSQFAVLRGYLDHETGHALARGQGVGTYGNLLRDTWGLTYHWQMGDRNMAKPHYGQVADLNYIDSSLDLVFYTFGFEPFRGPLNLLRGRDEEDLYDISNYIPHRAEVNGGEDEMSLVHLANLAGLINPELWRSIGRVYNYVSDGEIATNAHREGYTAVMTHGILSPQGPLVGISLNTYIDSPTVFPSFFQAGLWSSIGDHKGERTYGIDLGVERLRFPLRGLPGASFTLGSEFSFMKQPTRFVDNPQTSLMMRGSFLFGFESSSFEARVGFECKNAGYTPRSIRYEKGCQPILELNIIDPAQFLR